MVIQEWFEEVKDVFRKEKSPEVTERKAKKKWEKEQKKKRREKRKRNYLTDYGLW